MPVLKFVSIQKAFLVPGVPTRLMSVGHVEVQADPAPPPQSFSILVALSKGAIPPTKTDLFALSKYVFGVQYALFS